MTVIICAAMLCCALYFGIDRAEVVAVTNTSTSNPDIVRVDEIYKGVDTLNNTKHFSGENLSKLYASITGNSNATIADINSAVAGGAQITSQDIRDDNGGKDIVISFGGLDWTVTYLTQDKNGNTIVSLWLASSSSTLRWNPWTDPATSYAYPSNMYSSSYMRAAGLNSGSGYVASSGATTLTKVTQSTTHQYAKFTMPTAADSLTDFIVKPSAVSYQETQNHNSGKPISDMNQTLPNDAYGTPSGVINYYNVTGRNLNYTGKTGYTEWKDDYMWLPSLTETGSSSTIWGLWQLSNNQRSNSVATWLRSGSAYNAARSYYIAARGDSYDYELVNNSSSYAVRPALHLNLTAADNTAVYSLPNSIDVDYDGTTQSLQAIMQVKGVYYPAMILDSSTQLSGVNADTYKAKVSLSSPHYWLADNGSGGWTTTAGSTVKEISWEIKPRQLTITWSGISSLYIWRSTLLADLQRYKPVIGNGMAIDNLDVQLTYDGSASNMKLATAGAHKIKADIVTNSTASGAAALLTQNYIMPLANSMEYTYTVQKASQLAPILSIDYINEELIPTNPTVNGENRLPWLQYKDSSGNWQPIVNMKIPESIMTGDAYDFRYKVPAAYTDYIDDSGEYSLIVPKRQTAADLNIDYVQETLFIDSGYSYIVDKSKPSGGYNQLVASTTLHLDQLGYIETQGNTEYRVYYYKDATATDFASEIK
ncbi:MAG: hypothetical protein K2M44_04570, partial [Clostridia bacterium]|nr:hypothetical protein [Clostridia bacterium]